MHFTAICVLTFAANDIRTPLHLSRTIDSYVQKAMLPHYGQFVSYTIGDSWPGLLLAEQSRRLVVPGQESKIAEREGVPKHYRWIAGARKQDIAWVIMKDAAMERAKKDYLACQDILENGLGESRYYYDLKGDILYHYGMTAMRRGESFDDHIWRYDLSYEQRFPLRCSILVYKGQWFERPFSMEDDTSREHACAWTTQVDEIVGSIREDDFLVSLSCDI